MWARLKNKQIEIVAKDKARYLALGYTIKDTNGKTIAKPVDSKELVEALKKENSELRKQLAKK